MRNQYIFDVPIYRKSKNDFKAEINAEFAKHVEWMISSDPHQRPLNSETKIRGKDSIVRKYGGPWQFNQIIGWLRLFAEGYTIGGHLWWVDAQRLNRRMLNKRLKLITPSDVLHVRFLNESSTELFNKLLERFTAMTKESKYKNRYIDLDVFCRVGPIIDWRALLDGITEKNSRVTN
jgi:hypothetical protein